MIPHDEFKKYAVKHRGMSTMHLEKYMAQSVKSVPNMPNMGNMPNMAAGIQGVSVPNIHGFTPSVIEERQLNVAQMDVFSRLMMDRIIFMGVPVNDYVANVIQAQLLFLESSDPKRDVQLFINSPGGSVIDGMGIYDTMQYVSPDVATICTSMAASMGAFLLCSGAHGKRSALTHSLIMIHQPSGGMSGQFSDMEISYNLIKKLRQSLYAIMAKNCGKTFEEVERDSDRDNWMSSEQAKEYGLIDEVLSRKGA
jgi:ATP-dependent Clp protease, protease subunit